MKSNKDIYLEPTKVSRKIALTVGLSLAALGVVSVAIAGMSVPALMGALMLGTTASNLNPDVHAAGFGGFPYWGLTSYKSKRTHCPYDCKLTDEERDNLQKFLTGAECPIYKYYCISCKNNAAKFVSDIDGTTWVAEMKTPERLEVGAVLYMVNNYCFLKAYLEDINYDYSKYEANKKFWHVTSTDKVKFVNN